MIGISSVSYTNATIDDSAVNPDDPWDDGWLFLEQEYFPPEKQAADFNDVYNMLIRANSGLSAQSFVADACPVNVRKEWTDGANPDEVIIPLEFYVFTPRDDFEYELTTNVAEEYSDTARIKGRIINDGIGFVRKGYTTAFTMSNQIQFNHRLDDISYRWEHGVYDVWGSRLRGPSSGMSSTISLNDYAASEEVDQSLFSSPTQVRSRGRYLMTGEDVFGVIRLDYRAVAKLHTLELRLVPEAYEEFKNIRPTIIATWEYGGETHSQTLTLDIPQCVYDSLYLCPDGGDDVVVLINPFKEKYIVYYSTCDGSYLGVREAGSFKKDYYKAER